MDGCNVLVIVSDEHARDMAGCYGSPVARTPNLDVLAARGTVFTKGYTPSPICVPAASIHSAPTSRPRIFHKTPRRSTWTNRTIP